MTNSRKVSKMNIRITMFVMNFFIFYFIKNILIIFHIPHCPCFVGFEKDGKIKLKFSFSYGSTQASNGSVGTKLWAWPQIFLGSQCFWKVEGDGGLFFRVHLSWCAGLSLG
jgi:hypothetical protein